MGITDAKHSDIRRAIAGEFSIRSGSPESHAKAKAILQNGKSAAGEGWQLVKQNNLRCVYRVETDAGAIFVKAHVQSGAVQMLKSWLFGNPAQREFEASQYAQAHNIPCVDMFAVADFRAGGRFKSASLSGAIDNSNPLSSQYLRLEQMSSIRERSKLVASVARLLAVAHNARFLHADEHAGNIMVTRNEDDGFDCAYVDLYGARCDHNVGINEAVSSMASLGQWFRDRASRSVQLSFIKQYMGQRGYPQTPSFLRMFLSKVQAASHHHRQALYRKRDRRIGKSNSHFRRFDLTNGWRAWITLRFRTQPDLTGVVPHAWAHDISSTDLLEAFGVPPSGQPGDSLTDNSDASAQFSLTRWQGLAWCLFGSPIRRMHESGLRALNRDIPTELPTGYIEQQRGMIVSCSKKLVTRPPQCMPFDTLMGKLPNVQQRKLLERVGWMLARTFDHNLMISNISPQRIQVTCHQGENIPLWAGIVVRPTLHQVSGEVRNWMLTRMAVEAMRCQSGGTQRMARVLRACVRRGNPTHQWKEVWRKVQKSVALLTEEQI